jgi:hypothetical protein
VDLKISVWLKRIMNYTNITLTYDNYGDDSLQKLNKIDHRYVFYSTNYYIVIGISAP